MGDGVKGSRGLVLAIDQGTTSSRAIVFDDSFRAVASAQQEFEQHFPRSGWVEHEPEDLWTTTLAVCREALEKVEGGASAIAAVGITNQRETTVVWNRKTGKPVHRAIVWQDRRTTPICNRLKDAGHEEMVAARSGLLLDPYFSGTKIAWILENVEGARAAADAGELLFGTVDTWLMWKLTGGRAHVTDATNASRTLLYNIDDNCWDEELCALLGVPMSMLPQVRDSSDEFGTVEAGHFGAELPILGVAGDQQAATVGQACFAPGMVKSTYGTGCFALINTGASRVTSRNRLLSTIAYRLDGKTTYALEGSIFVAGSAVQWLRDGLGIIEEASQTQQLAADSDPANRLYLVPAFVGLGAPYWDPDARGALFGLTRASGPADFCRAALESVGYQTRDLIDAMRDDAAHLKHSAKDGIVLRVDGGMTASDWTMQFLSDILGAPVDRPQVLETTALGAAWLAGQKAGVWPGMDAFAEDWRLDRRFEPALEDAQREALYEGWQDAVRRTRTN